MSGLVVARQELENYASLARYQHSAYGDTPKRVGDRWVFLPNAGVMVEATFRLMKYIQHGGPSSLTDAAGLWAKASDSLEFLESKSLESGLPPTPL